MTPISKDTGFEHPEDGWYHLEPFGEHLNRVGGVIQSITPEAGASIVENFNAAADAGTLPQGHEMLIDHEHFKDDAGKESIAYGWLQELELRADGIYGRIRWTAIGQASVDGGEYRFFSTEYELEDAVALGGDPPRVRPMRLAGLTLTNMPNNRGGKPITNRAGAGGQLSDPKTAGRAFSLIVNRIRGEHACTFDAAWNDARQRYSVLFAAMGGAESGTAQPPTLNRAASSKAAAGITESEAKSASNRFAMLVRNRAEESKLPFEQAWNDVGREFQDLLGRASGRVLNRSGYFIDPADQKKADAQAPDVLWDLRRETKGIPDRGQTTKTVFLKCAFLSALDLLQKDGKSLEEAFAYLRENEPVFWLRGVLSYNIKADDAVQFKDFEADKTGVG